MFSDACAPPSRGSRARACIDASSDTASPACPPLPDQASKRGSFADTTIGYVHIDTSDLRLAQGKLVMFLAIDRVSKFTYVEFRDNAGKMNGADFLRGVVARLPIRHSHAPC